MGVTAVQVQSNQLNGAGTSIGVTVNGIAAGNLLSIATNATAFDTSNVTDGTLTSSVADVSGTQSSMTQHMALFKIVNHPGGNKTLTANFAGSGSFRSIRVLELTGADTVTPLDGTASSMAGFDATPTTGNLSPAPAVAGEYIVGWCMSSASALTSGAGFTDLVNDTVVNDSDFEGLAQSVAAAVAATWTLGSTQSWGALAASYKPGAAVATANKKLLKEDGKGILLETGTYLFQ